MIFVQIWDSQFPWVVIVALLRDDTQPWSQTNVGVHRQQAFALLSRRIQKRSKNFTTSHRKWCGVSGCIQQLSYFTSPRPQSINTLWVPPFNFSYHHHSQQVLNILSIAISSSKKDNNGLMNVTGNFLPLFSSSSTIAQFLKDRKKQYHGADGFYRCASGR